MANPQQWPMRETDVAAFFPNFQFVVGEPSPENWQERAFQRQRDEALQRAADAESELNAFKWGSLDAITQHLATRFDCQVTILVGLDEEQRARRAFQKESERHQTK